MLNQCKDDNSKRNYYNPLGNYSKKIILQSITHMMDFILSVDHIDTDLLMKKTSVWISFWFPLIFISFNTVNIVKIQFGHNVIELFDSINLPIQFVCFMFISVHQFDISSSPSASTNRFQTENEMGFG